LSFYRFVQDSLDDNEGNRTLKAIENYHGIVKFEVATVLSKDDEEPKSTWKILEPFQEKTSIPLKLQEGKLYTCIINLYNFQLLFTFKIEYVFNLLKHNCPVYIFIL
jgi:hypothetical protein